MNSHTPPCILEILLVGLGLNSNPVLINLTPWLLSEIFLMILNFKKNQKDIKIQ